MLAKAVKAWSLLEKRHGDKLFNIPEWQGNRDWFRTGVSDAASQFSVHAERIAGASKTPGIAGAALLARLCALATPPPLASCQQKPTRTTRLHKHNPEQSP